MWCRCRWVEGKEKWWIHFLFLIHLSYILGKKHPGHILTHGSLLKFSHNLRMTEVRWLVVSRETKFGLVNTGTPWWGRAGARRCDPGESHIPTHPGSSAHCGTGSGYGGGWVTQLPDTALHWCTEGGKAPYPQVDSVYTERLAGVLLLPTYSAV